MDHPLVGDSTASTLKPNQLKIGSEDPVEIHVVTNQGCGAGKPRGFGCRSILRVDHKKMRAWLCREKGSSGVCIGLNHGGPFRGSDAYRGEVCSLTQDFASQFGTCGSPGRGARRSTVTGPALNLAVGQVLDAGKSKMTMYWKEHEGEGRGEFTSFAPDSDAFSTVEYPGATTRPKLDKLQDDAKGRVYSYTGPYRLQEDITPPGSPHGVLRTGGRKRRGRKRRTRRTRGRRRRSTHKRKRRVRRRGTRRR